MKDAVLTGELAVLVHLTDEVHDPVGPLRPISEHFDRAQGGRTVRAVRILTVIEGLKRILEEEDLLALVRLHDVVSVVEQVRDHDVLATDETRRELQALGHHANLVERFLTGVEQADVARLGDCVRQLQKHRGLTGTGSSRGHHDRGGRETRTTHRLIEPTNTGRDALLQCVRDVDVQDVRVRLETLDADRKIHRCHVIISPWCPVVLFYQASQCFFTDSPAFSVPCVFLFRLTATVNL